MGKKPVFVKKTIDPTGTVIFSSPVLPNAGQRFRWANKAKRLFPGESETIDHEMDHGIRDGKRGNNPSRIGLRISPSGERSWFYHPVGNHGGKTELPSGKVIGRSPQRILKIVSVGRMSLGDLDLYRTVSAMVRCRRRLW